MSNKLTYSPKRKQTVSTEQAMRESEICTNIIRNLYVMLDDEREARALAEAKARAAKNRLRRSQQKVASLRYDLNEEAERTETVYDDYRDLYYRHDRVMEDQEALVARCEEREREIGELRDQLHRVRRVAAEFWGGEGTVEEAGEEVPPSPIPYMEEDAETVTLSYSMDSYAGREVREVDDFPGIADAFYGRG